MATVTIRGGSGLPAQSINFTTDDSFYFARLAAVEINSDPAASLSSLSGGGVDATGTDGDRTIVGGSGGFTLNANTGNFQIVLAGGNNDLSFGSQSVEQIAIGGGGKNTIFAEGNASVDAGTGHNLIVGGGSLYVYSTGTDEIFGGNGTGGVSVEAYGANDTIGTGANSGSNVIADFGAGGVFYLSGGADSLFAAGNAAVILAGAGSAVIAEYGNRDTVALGSGAASVSVGGANGVIFGGSGTGVYSDTGAFNTIVGGTGAMTLTGGSKGTYFLSKTSTLFTGSKAANGSDTLVGASAGSETVFGGRSDLVFAGSSSLDFVGGSGSATINGGAKDTVFGNAGSRITYFASTSGGALIAGAGSETLTAAQSSAGVTEVAGAGTASLVGGGGDDTFFGGTGNNTMTGSAGSNVFAFTKGSTAGTDTITDFKAVDQVILFGYGAGEVANALASAKTSGGSTTITLADNSKVHFVGVSSLNSGNFSGF